MPAIKSLMSVAAVLALCVGGQTTHGGTHPVDPCGAKNSNRDMRECYAHEQVRVDAEVDALAEKTAAGELKQATNPLSEGMDADLLKKAASAMTLSQRTWRAYRDQHCKAVEYSWTLGSGAGTAYERCMFQLGKARVEQLRSDFDLR